MKSIATFFAAWACALAYGQGTPGQEQRLGLFLQGNRIGQSVYRTSREVVNAVTLRRSDSSTVMDAALLGTALNMKIDSTTWSDDAGRPVRMTFDMTSSGRSQKVDARFGQVNAEITVVNSGTTSKRTLKIPKDASIVDDPMTELIVHGALRKKVSFYVLDPTTVSFIRNTASVQGPAKVQVNGRERQGTAVLIEDPRVSMTAYVDGKGELIKVDGPMGIEMIPEDASVAPASTGAPATTPIDLANATSIPVERKIDDPSTATQVKLRLTGRDLHRAPSDDHQTVKGEGLDWTIDIHPPKLSATPGARIAEAAAQFPSWTKPGLNIPSDSPRFKKLAGKLTKGKGRVRDASLAIRQYVHEIMRPNAGIGVLRNADEVLNSKEGVCRDYAILTATLLRAAGIPAKVSSGLVYYNGRFYYHAWADAWDGKRWIGLDSTVAEDQVSATHIQLATGSVEDAFTFTFLEKAKIEVLEVRN